VTKKELKMRNGRSMMMMKSRRVMNRLVHVAAAVFVAGWMGLASARAADRPDAWVTLKTKVSLMTTDNLSTKNLNVDTVMGVVTLHGMVATEAEKARAEQVAMTIEGVRQVKNLLQVVPEARREVVERADAEIKRNVESAFKANHRIRDSGIKVASVNKGVVLLSGTTKSMEAYAESVDVADAVTGVRRVSTEVTAKN
jgi:osmotically-inducible protein OsmY